MISPSILHFFFCIGCSGDGRMGGRNWRHPPIKLYLFAVMEVEKYPREETSYYFFPREIFLQVKGDAYHKAIRPQYKNDALCRSIQIWLILSLCMCYLTTRKKKSSLHSICIHWPVKCEVLSDLWDRPHSNRSLIFQRLTMANMLANNCLLTLILLGENTEQHEYPIGSCFSLMFLIFI